MSFLLTEWYEVVYDEGFFYDDITFVVEGKKFTFTDKHYDEISDQYFANEFHKLEGEEARLEKERDDPNCCCHCEGVGKRTNQRTGAYGECNSCGGAGVDIYKVTGVCDCNY